MNSLRILAGLILLSTLSVPTGSMAADASRAASQNVVKPNLPLFFEANRGQMDPRFQFMSRSAGYTLLVSPTDALLVAAQHPAGKNTRNTQEDSPASSRAVLRMHLVGANPAATATGVDELPGKINYLIGDNPNGWHSNIPTFARVRTWQVYAGVDLVFHGNERQLEYDFVVSPGADASQIALAMSGADKIEIDVEGNLILHTGPSQLVMHKPVIYQLVGRSRKLVEGSFQLRQNHEVAFAVGAYDPHRPLVIDPSIAYATFLGGDGDDQPHGLQLDTSTPGKPKLYLGGATTDITTFPETSSLIGTSPGGTSYSFVAKIDPTLKGASSLDYLTFVGGSTNFAGVTGCDSQGFLSLDKSQGASDIEPVISGATTCKNYPVNAGEIGTVTGGSAFFVTRLATTGASLDLSLLIGGNGAEFFGGGLATVDSSGGVELASYTTSTNLPVTTGAYMTKINNGLAGTEDCFVAKLSRQFAVQYLSYLNVGEGTTSSSPSGFCFLAEDPSGQLLATGVALSNAVFVAAGGANGFQSAFQGLIDTFLMKLNIALSGTNELTYGSYFGGGGITILGSGALLGPGIVALGGNTTSGTSTNPTNIPIKNAYLSTNVASSSSDKGIGFFAVVDTAKTGTASLICSSYFGGSGGDDKVQGMTYDPTPGNSSHYRLVLGGQTTSANFPTLNPFQPSLVGSQNGFVSVVNAPTLTSGPAATLAFSTYIGGGVSAPQHENENITGLQTDPNHTIYASGRTASSNYYGNTSPATTVNGFQTTCTSCSLSTPTDDTVVFDILMPGVTLSPSLLSFASQLVQTTSPPKTVTLTNSGGSGPLTISSITAFGNFTATNQTCPLSPSTLAVGSQCTFTVTFTPSQTGKVLGEVTVTDNAPSIMQNLNLSGSGVTPLNTSPNSLSFGNVAVGATSAAKSLTLINNSTTTLTIGFSASADYAAVGSGTTPCGGSLAGKAKCTISVTFTPKSNGTINGAVTITYNATFSPIEVGLSGSGTGGGTSPLTFSVASLSFASQLVGTRSAAKIVTVTNSSASSVTISSISSSGDFSAAASGATPCSNGKVLAATQSCTFSVTFSPTVNGSISGAAWINDSSAITPQVLNLSGKGAEAVSLSPGTLNFGTVPVGTVSAPKTVTVTNNNQSAAITLNTIVASGDFQINPGTCTSSLAAKSKCMFSISFAPTLAGALSGVASVPYVSIGSPQVVDLTGTGQ